MYVCVIKNNIEYNKGNWKIKIDITTYILIITVDL